MHEVELVRRVWNRLQEGYDYNTSEPNRWALSQAMIERVVQTTLRILGIPIRPDGSVVIAAATPTVEASPPLGLTRQQELEAARNLEPDCDYGAVGAVGAGRYRALNEISRHQQPTDLRVVEILPWSNGLIWETVGIFGGERADELAIACVQQIPDGRAQAIRIAMRLLNPAEPLPATPTLGDLFNSPKPEDRP